MTEQYVSVVQNKGGQKANSEVCGRCDRCVQCGSGITSGISSERLFVCDGDIKAYT